LTYKNTFVEARKLLKGETLPISQKLDATPSYNLHVKFNITNTPFTFGSQVPVVGTLTAKTTIRIRNTISYLTILGILILAGIAILLIEDLERRTGKISGVHHTKHVAKGNK
jgi:tellurite resistance protein TehA-like permease